MGYKPDPAHCSSQKFEEQYKFKIYCSKTLRAWIWKERLEFKRTGVVLQFQFEDIEDLDLEEKAWVWNTDFQAWIYSSSSTTLRRRAWIWKKKLEFKSPGVDLQFQFEDIEDVDSEEKIWIWTKHWLEFGRKDLSLNLQAWIHSSRLENTYWKHSLRVRTIISTKQKLDVYSSSSTTLRFWIWKKKLEFKPPGVDSVPGLKTLTESIGWGSEPLYLLSRSLTLSSEPLDLLSKSIGLGSEPLDLLS